MKKFSLILIAQMAFSTSVLALNCNAILKQLLKTTDYNENLNGINLMEGELLATGRGGEGDIENFKKDKKSKVKPRKRTKEVKGHDLAIVWNLNGQKVVLDLNDKIGLPPAIIFIINSISVNDASFPIQTNLEESSVTFNGHECFKLKVNSSAVENGYLHPAIQSIVYEHAGNKSYYLDVEQSQRFSPSTEDKRYDG